MPVLTLEISPWSNPGIQSSEGTVQHLSWHTGVSGCHCVSWSLSMREEISYHSRHKKWNLSIGKSLSYFWIGIRWVVDGSGLIKNYQRLLTMIFHIEEKEHTGVREIAYKAEKHFGWIYDLTTGNFLKISLIQRRHIFLNWKCEFNMWILNFTCVTMTIWEEEIVSVENILVTRKDLAWIWSSGVPINFLHWGSEPLW